MLLSATTPAMSIGRNAEVYLDPEPVWSKSKIARRAKRYKIAEMRAARREKVSMRRLASSVAQAAMRSTVDNRSRMKIFRKAECTERRKMVEIIAVAPCVSKCHSSASRTAAKFEERAIRRFDILRPQRIDGRLTDEPLDKEVSLHVSRRLDCIKCVMLRETYIATTAKTIQKLDKYYTRLHEMGQTAHVGSGDGGLSSATTPHNTSETKLWKLVQFSTSELTVLLDQLRLVSLHLP